MAEQWLSIVEYARAFSVSDMTVRRRIKNGKLHAVLKEGKYFIPVTGNQAPPAEPASPTKEMSIIRGHPKAETTYGQSYAAPVSPTPKAYDETVRQVAQQTPAPNNYIPESLRQPIEAKEQTVADTRALLAFCEASLRKFSDLERRQVEKFKAKLQVVEMQIAAKDKEICDLKQQVEDLQLLVKVIESKKN